MTGLYDSERATFMTPFLPELNEYYGRNYYFFQGCNQDRQVFGIGLPCIGGQVIGFWIGHNLQTTADDKSQFRQLTRQLIRKVAFNFGDGLGRGDTLDQGDFPNRSTTWLAPCSVGEAAPAKMTSASRKTIGFFIDSLGHAVSHARIRQGT
jgi:hypothetical protein